jgi:hypothetical protein
LPFRLPLIFYFTRFIFLKKKNMRKIIIKLLQIFLDILFIFERVAYYIQTVPYLNILINTFGDDIIRLFWQWLS